MKNNNQFFKKLPRILKVPANSAKIIFANDLDNSRVKINENSKTVFIFLLKNGWINTKEIHFDFEEENSEIIFLCFILGAGKNKFPFETTSNHRSPKTKGHYYIRGLTFDQSEIEYKGNLNIKPNAKHTDCYLSSHAMMLSENSKVTLIPCLEIETDDVKASHTASIGKIDEDLLYYLQTRGLNKKAGQNLLIKSFFEADLQKIPDKNIKNFLAKEIENSLKNYYLC